MKFDNVKALDNLSSKTIEYKSEAMEKYIKL